MKLYKILKMVGDKGVSVFPPEEQEFPESAYFVPWEWNQNFAVLRALGFTDAQAGKALKCWEWTARYTLGQGPEGCRLFVKRCLHEISGSPPTVPFEFWPIVMLFAAIAATALALYLWVTLDKELNYTFGAHEWAYLMSYQERLWQGEVLTVGSKQIAYYERGALFGNVVSSHDRGSSSVGGRDWIWFLPGLMVLEGRRLIFYHVYRFSGFYVRFLGVMTKVGAGLYKLREGGEDRYKPYGPWSRPGGRWGTADYEGCWQPDWWWL